MPVKDQVTDILRMVIDPELTVNIVDLGLVYGIRCDEPLTRIDIDLTFSTPGCPLGDVIVEDIYYRLQAQYPEADINIHVVWDPPWSPERMTEAGRVALGKA
jgi:metal-sulfur cluster biosynthetic enzyme